MSRKPRRQGTGATVWIYAASHWIQKPDNVAGYAAIIKNRTTGESSQISGVVTDNPETTGIRAEMVAIVEALETLPDDCTVTIWAENDFMPKAIRYEYKRKANLDVWDRLDKQLVRHTLKRFRHEPRYFNKPAMVEAHALAQAATQPVSPTMPEVICQ